MVEEHSLAVGPLGRNALGELSFGGQSLAVHVPALQLALDRLIDLRVHASARTQEDSHGFGPLALTPGLDPGVKSRLLVKCLGVHRRAVYSQAMFPGLTSVFVILACYVGWIIVKRITRLVIAKRKRRQEAALPKPEPKRVSRSGRPIHRLQDYRTPAAVEDEPPPPTEPEPRVHLEPGSYYVIGQDNSYGYAVGAIVLVTEREILAFDEGRPALARTPEADAEFATNVARDDIRFVADVYRAGNEMAQSLREAFRGFDQGLGRLDQAVQRNSQDLRSLWSTTTTTTTRTRTGRAPANPEASPVRPVKAKQEEPSPRRSRYDRLKEDDDL